MYAIVEKKVYDGACVAVAVATVLQYAASAVVVVAVDVSSRHRPNQPLDVQVVVAEVLDEVVVVVVVSSLQPNQPGYRVSSE